MGPLHGYTVIELAGIGPAPMGGMMLADMGAEVIRIDRAAGASALVMKDVSWRGKKSLDTSAAALDSTSAPTAASASAHSERPHARRCSERKARGASASAARSRRTGGRPGSDLALPRSRAGGRMLPRLLERVSCPAFPALPGADRMPFQTVAVSVPDCSLTMSLSCQCSVVPVLHRPLRFLPPESCRTRGVSVHRGKRRTTNKDAADSPSIDRKSKKLRGLLRAQSSTGAGACGYVTPLSAGCRPQPKEIMLRPR